MLLITKFINPNYKNRDSIAIKQKINKPNEKSKVRPFSQTQELLEL